MQYDKTLERNIKDRTRFLGPLSVEQSIVFLLAVLLSLIFLKNNLWRVIFITAMWCGSLYFTKGRPSGYFLHWFRFLIRSIRKKMAIPARYIKGNPF